MMRKSDRNLAPRTDAVTRDPIPHVVSVEPFDPMSVEAMSAGQERYYQS